MTDGSSNVTLTNNTTQIDTSIKFGITGAYLVFKINTIQMEFVVANHPSLLSSYVKSYKEVDLDPTSETYGKEITASFNAVRITLPIIDNVQQQIPFAGQWTITFYNTREVQKQSLSKALRPKADI